ncbi:terminase small subunit [Pseudomonas ovata]|uniref:terminase small subunit n=1 Tax=Pseudomonas ovata TaxID=1839709 RepID=UPI000D68FC4E|nr:terminase small subunit [Pseudomonas ovata]
MALTDKKRRFVDALLSGASNREAAISAGYSEKTASQAGSKLAKDADVLAEFGNHLHQKAASSTKVKPSQKVKAKCPEDGAPDAPSFAETEDPQIFLTELMNSGDADLRMRLEAAKALMPYKHGKVADQGKKDAKADAAKNAGKGRYSQSRPPLTVVKG